MSVPASAASVMLPSSLLPRMFTMVENLPDVNSSAVGWPPTVMPPITVSFFIDSPRAGVLRFATMPSTSRATSPALRADASRTSSCEVGAPVPWTLVISEKPTTSRPSARAAIVSSTVYMPTASAPIVRR